MEVPVTAGRATSSVLRVTFGYASPQSSRDYCNKRCPPVRSNKPKGRIRRSCDLCFRRKKKCDGDGFNHCSYCFLKGQVKCTYDFHRWDIPNKLKEKARHQKPSAHGREAVKHVSTLLPRCRFGASMATGLAGMEENVLLSDYFNCLGCHPLASPSEIREAIVHIMSSKGSSELTGHRLVAPGVISPGSPREEGGEDACTGAADSPHRCGLVCIFWGTVALGGLLQGRSEELVARYVSLAEGALSPCRSHALFEVARALGIMAVLYSFLVRDKSTVDACLEHRLKVVRELNAAEAKELMGEEFSAYAQHSSYGEDLKRRWKKVADFFAVLERPSERTRLESTGHSEKDIISHIAKLGSPIMDMIICTAMNTLMSTGHETRMPDTSLQGFGDEGVPIGRSHLSEPNAPGSQSGPAPYAALRSFIQDNKDSIDRLRREARRPTNRSDLTAVLHCFLAIVSIALGDREGAVEAVYSCADLFIRYPGMGRFTIANGTYTLVTLVIASVGDHATYDNLAAGFNALCLDGKPRIPPLEERLDQFICDCTLVCRIYEQYLREHGWGSAVPSRFSTRIRDVRSGDPRIVSPHILEADHVTSTATCRDLGSSTTSYEDSTAPCAAVPSTKKTESAYDHGMVDAGSINWSYSRTSSTTSNDVGSLTLSEDATASFTTLSLTGRIANNHDQVPVVVNATDWKCLADALSA